MGIWQNDFGKPITDGSGAMLDCADYPCDGCGGGGGECTIEWDEFTDRGFIDGGQDGALRTYATVGSVSNSPWTVNAHGLRCTFEDSADDEPRNTGFSDPGAGDGNGSGAGPGCASHNHFNQLATATGSFTLASDGYLTIEWEGMGEQQDGTYELMRVSVDSVEVARAHSPGGNLECAAMAPVVSSPTSPVILFMAAGTHTIEVAATTADSWYHNGAYYQFALTCGTAEPDCADCPPTASFDYTLDADCTYTFTSTSTAGTCGTEITSCAWVFEMTIDDDTIGYGTMSGCEVSVDFNDCPPSFELRYPCDDPCGTYNPRFYCRPRSFTAKLTVTDDAGCVATTEQTFSCGCEPPGTMFVFFYELIDCVAHVYLGGLPPDACGNEICVRYIEDVGAEIPSGSCPPDPETWSTACNIDDTYHLTFNVTGDPCVLEVCFLAQYYWVGSCCCSDEVFCFQINKVCPECE